MIFKTLGQYIAKFKPKLIPMNLKTAKISLEESEKRKILLILGPTGCGKTKLSIEICQKFDGEVVSTDSMQLYRALDIATNKISREEMENVPHHMMSFLHPLTLGYTVVNFRNQALDIIADIHSRGKLPVIVGGTNYYVEALLWKILLNDAPQDESKNLSFDALITSVPESLLTKSDLELHQILEKVDPVEAARTLPNARRRVLRCLQYFYRTGEKISDKIASQKQTGDAMGGPLRFKDSCILWLQCEQEVLDRRLEERIQKMMKDGLLDELMDFYDEFHEKYRQILDEDLNNLVKDSWDKGLFQCIGFKEFRDFLKLDGNVRSRLDNPKTKKAIEKGVALLEISNRQYARRQNKWIRYRCLVSDREAPPLYKIDVSNLDLWTTEISPLACHIVENFLQNREPSLVNLEPKIEPKFRGNVRLNRKCDVCEGKIMNGLAWELHEKSWAHRQNLRKRKLLEEVCRTLDFLVESVENKISSSLFALYLLYYRKMAFLDFLGWTATVSTYGMFLVGVSICQTIYRKRSVGDITALPFIMCCTNCFFWLIYGFLKNERTIVNVNIVGFALQFAYVVFYYAYAKDKRIINLQIVSALLFSCLGLAHVKFSGYPVQSLIDHTGSMCLLLNVLNFASPLVALKEVVNRKSTESISFALCLANLLVSGQWFLYGILVDDIYMKVPNFLGLILTLIQLSLFAMYPQKLNVGHSKK